MSSMLVLLKIAIILFYSKKKKPLVSKVTVKAVMVGSGDASDKSDVPILASCLIPGNVTVACGNPVQPIFEKVVSILM